MGKGGKVCYFISEFCRHPDPHRARPPAHAIISQQTHRDMAQLVLLGVFHLELVQHRHRRLEPGIAARNRGRSREKVYVDYVWRLCGDPRLGIRRETPPQPAGYSHHKCINLAGLAGAAAVARQLCPAHWLPAGQVDQDANHIPVADARLATAHT
jgi:hypothetical protein